MPFPRKFKKTLLNAYVLHVLTISSELVLFTFIFRKLPVSDVGLYSWASAILAFFIIFLDMGVKELLVREFSLNKSINGILVYAFKIRTPVIIVALILYACWYLSGVSSANAYLVILFLGIIQIISYSESIFLAFLRSFERQTEVNLFAFMNSVLRLTAGIVPIVLFEKYSLVLLVAGLLMAKIVNFTIVCIYYSSTKRNISNRDIASEEFHPETHLKSSLTFLGIGLLMALQTRGDWLIINSLLNAEALANYALANKFFEISMSFFGVLLATTYPWYCKMINNKTVSTNYHFFFGFYVLICVYWGFGIFIFAPSVISSVFTDKYVYALPPLKILGIALIFSAVNGLLYQMLMAKGKEMMILKMTFGFIVIQLLADVLLIPIFNTTGAAIGMLLCYLAAMVTFLVMSFRQSLIPLANGRRLIMAVIVSCVGLTLIQINSNIIINALAVVALFLFSATLVFLNASDRHYVIHYLKG